MTICCQSYVYTDNAEPYISTQHSCTDATPLLYSSMPHEGIYLAGLINLKGTPEFNKLNKRYLCMELHMVDVHSLVTKLKAAAKHRFYHIHKRNQAYILSGLLKAYRRLKQG